LSNELKIREIRLYSAKSPLSQPIADATHDIPEIKFLIVEIETVSGILGQGYLLVFHFNEQAITGAFRDLKDFVNHDYYINETIKLCNKYAEKSEYFGREGLLTWPAAALNLAMWDAWGKFKQQPVWKLLNGQLRKIPVYGSGGWLSYSNDELLDEVMAYKSRGFQAVKIKVGSTDLERDVERLKKVREAIGRDLKIMIDANQGMQVADAINLFQKTKTLNIDWFEEPVDHHDYHGFAEIKKNTGANLAMGEREYNIKALSALTGIKALDIWQPDIIRIGGVEAWRESAFKAESAGIDVAPHYYKDYDIPLLCTINNGIAAESFDWIDGLIDKPMKIENGFTLPRKEPGWGFLFQHASLEEIPL